MMNTTAARDTDSVRDYLDQALPGWRDERDLEEQAMQNAQEIVARAAQRELEGRNKLPQFKARQKAPEEDTLVGYPDEYLVPAMRRIYSLVSHELSPGLGGVPALERVEWCLREWNCGTEHYLKADTRSRTFEEEHNEMEKELLESVALAAGEGRTRWSSQARLDLEERIYRQLEWIYAELGRLRPGTAPRRVCHLRGR